MNGIFRKTTFAVATLAMTCGMALYARADGQAKVMTGVVTDMACGRSHSMMKGNGSDAQCVRTCVKGGSPFGLVVGDNVIELRGHSGELNKYAAQKVTVSGTMRGKDLIVESVKPAK
ncbi:MAG: hypothetical protein ACRD5K_03760 [Candidatus Acidiferrales bacterium]